MKMRTLLVLACLSAPVAAQASFTAYGTGCNPSNPPPLIRNSGLPVLGTTFTVSFAALPSGRTPVSEDWPLFLMGLQQTQVPVPVLSSLQPPNCFLYTSTEFVVPMPWLGSSFDNQVAIAVPNNAALMGFTLYMQWAELYSSCRPTCVPSMIRVTNGAAAVLGL
ncbi:MAG: hypothetical protein R3F56_19705 [Planctomycetota bacterium]